MSSPQPGPRLRRKSDGRVFATRIDPETGDTEFVPDPPPWRLTPGQVARGFDVVTEGEMAMSETTFRAKPFEFKASQWFKAGDHPAVVGPTQYGAEIAPPYVKTRQGRAGVHPGDWIITMPDGETYPCRHDLFIQKYEPVPDRLNAEDVPKT